MSSISVELINHMGTDLSVCDAARVSFDKQASQYTPEQNAKLINYLAKHNHKSPFNHCFATFRVKAPIFVARQLVKHEYMPWNEVSRRYVDSEPEFYIPDTWRKKADNVKQGSSDEAIKHSDGWGNEYDALVEDLAHFYHNLLADGVCPEQARMVLPQSMMTTWIWSGSLFAIAKMCKLRLDPHTQYESRIVAEKIKELIMPLFPVSLAALLENA